MNAFKKIKSKRTFNAPKDWLKIKTIDMHTGGEPLRVVIDGLPDLIGGSILECRRYMRENYDHLRKTLMFEPRGHADMYGCILISPNDDSADFGILFIHNEGYSTMCGHAIIAITNLAIEMDWVNRVEPETKVLIDAPCGRITSYARLIHGKVDSVFFHCVPSFVVALDQEIEVPSLGKITYDLAYGGAFYAYVNAKEYNISLDQNNYSQLIDFGMRIKNAIIESSVPITHPFEEDLSFLYGTIFIGQPTLKNADSKNVCIFAEGEVDRSPTGSGVSGRMAIHYMRKEIKIGQQMTIESITGSVFKGSVVKEVTFGPYQAIMPQVEGNAHITGKHEFLIDPEDPFKEGFILR